MRIAVMGAGGTGGYFGALLARAGHDVTFIARGAHLEAIRNDGLTVKSSLSGDFTIPVEATDSPREMEPVELVLFSVKTYDTEPATELIRPIVGSETLVLSLQNGVDNRDRIGRILGQETTICASTHVSSKIESPGVIAQTAGGGRIVFGEWEGGTSPRTVRLKTVFQDSGIKGELHPDIEVKLWEKFLAICAFSGVPALTRLPIGPIMACRESSVFIRSTMDEVEAIARAEGIRLPTGCVELVMDEFIGMEPHARGSMYYDLAAGRRLELETLNGTVVRLGNEYGIPTPCNFAIYAALKPYLEDAPVLPK